MADFMEAMGKEEQEDALVLQKLCFLGHASSQECS
jgi:hypothetical protein